MEIKIKVKTFIINNLIIFFLILSGTIFTIFYTCYKYVEDRENLKLAKCIAYLIDDLQKERFYTFLIRVNSNDENIKNYFANIIKKFKTDFKYISYYYEDNFDSYKDSKLSRLLFEFQKNIDILQDIRKNILNVNSANLPTLAKLDSYYTSQVNILLKILNYLKFNFYSSDLVKNYTSLLKVLIYKEALSKKNLVFSEAILTKNINQTNLLISKGKVLEARKILELDDNSKFFENILEQEKYLKHIEENILKGNIKNISFNAYFNLIERKDDLLFNFIKNSLNSLENILYKEYFIKLFVLITVFIILLAFILFELLGLLNIKKKFDFYISELEYVLKRINQADYTVRLYKISNDELAQIIDKINKIILILERALKRLKESNLKERIIISSLSHEIKNTLNATIGYLELLELSPNLGEKEKLFLKNAIKACRLSLENLQEILDYHKITLKKASIEYEPINIYELVKEAVSLTCVKVKPSNIQIKYKNLENLPTLYGPKRQLLQILINLISNAIKYTFEGYVEIGVKDIKQIDNVNVRLTLYVKDTGIGISDKIKDKIFKVPFLKDNLNLKIPSTGLGLYFTKKIVDFIGGKIYFETKQGKGTTFYLEIPLKTCLPKDNQMENKAKNQKFSSNNNLKKEV